MTKPIERSRLDHLLNNVLSERAAVMPVDDDAQSRELVRRHLRQSKAEMFEASNAREALALLSEIPAPDLVFLDLTMPEADGFTVLDEIAKHAPWRLTPIIILTARELRSAELSGPSLRPCSRGDHKGSNTVNDLARWSAARCVCAVSGLLQPPTRMLAQERDDQDSACRRQ